jgi:hypothetical protein
VSSGISYSSVAASSQWLKELHDYQALTSAIQKGDIQGIMRAYSAWQQDLKAAKASNQQVPKQTQAAAPTTNSSQAQSPSQSNKPATPAFPATQDLAKAIALGDPNGIQAAVTALQKNLKGLGQTKSGANGTDSSPGSGATDANESLSSAINSPAVINSISSISSDSGSQNPSTQSQSGATTSASDASSTASEADTSSPAPAASESADSFTLNTLS